MAASVYVGTMPGSKYPVPPLRPRMTVESPAIDQKASTYGFTESPLVPHSLLSLYPTLRSAVCSVWKAWGGEFHGLYVNVSEMLSRMVVLTLTKTSISFHGPTKASCWFVLTLFQMPPTSVKFLSGPKSPIGKTSPPTGCHTTPAFSTTRPRGVT